MWIFNGDFSWILAHDPASDPGVPVSLEDLWPPNLGDAVTDAAVEEAPHGGTWMWMLLDDNRWASQVVSGNKALLRDY